MLVPFGEPQRRVERAQQSAPFAGVQQGPALLILAELVREAIAGLFGERCALGGGRGGAPVVALQVREVRLHAEMGGKHGGVAALSRRGQRFGGCARVAVAPAAHAGKTVGGVGAGAAVQRRVGQRAAALDRLFDHLQAARPVAE